ncbi:MAG TPA: PTS sugar transporter subunit IIA [Spirochaetota bacterium]|nr:PTS sugar transporter subunit IIA [Spirochaetota bacterium]
MSDIIEYTSTDFIKIVESEDKFGVIEELASLFSEGDVCTDIKALIAALKDRERIMSTGIGFGIAIPHAKIEQVKNISFAVGISKKGVEFDSMDGKPVHLIILVAAGDKQHKHYLSLMSNIMTVLKNDEIKEKIIDSTDKVEILRLLGSC